MNRERFKPSVPRRCLFFMAAFVWAFASWRVLMAALASLLQAPVSLWVDLLLGIAGFAVFFRMVFLRVSRRHIRRITALSSNRPCAFAFFGWKSYLLIAAMVFSGIMVSRLHLLPAFAEGIFYMALGLSLLLSSGMLASAGFRYRDEKAAAGNGFCS